jgi:hypothetical protein
MMKFILILLLSSLFSVGHAFMNIEALRQSTTLGFKGNTGFRLSGASGNTDRIVGSVTTLNAYQTTNREFLFLMNYEYGSSRGLKNSNKGSSHLRHAYRFERFPTFEQFAQFQFDEFKRLRSRTLLGIGLREGLWLKPHFTFYVGAGVFHEWERLDEGVNLTAHENDWRANIYTSLLYKMDKEERFQGTLILYFQPLMEALEDNRLIVDKGVRFKLNSFLFYNLNLLMSRDTRPPKNVRRTDWVYTTGFSIDY